MNQNLQKNLGLAPALSTVIGMVIGGGVFFKPQAVYSLTSGAPGLGMIAWVVAGIITITAGLTAAEVSAAIPKTGGMMVYIEEIYGKKLGVLTGWMQCVLFFPASIAALAVMFGSQSATLIGNESLVVPITLGTILLISILNTISSKTSGLIQTVATICKLIPLILIIVFGFINGGGTNSLTSPLVGPGISTGSVIGQLLIAILFAYDGWINVGALAGEMKNPGKDLPKAFAGGILIIMAIYLLVNVAYLWVLPADQLKDCSSPAVAVAEVIFGPVGGKIIAAGILISVFGALNGFLLSGSRVAYTLGVQKMIPGYKAFGKLNASDVPGNGVLLIGALACIYALTGQFNLLTDLATFTGWVFYVMTFIAVIILRRTKPDIERVYKVPLYPIVPGIAIVGGGFVLINQLFMAGSGPRMVALAGIGITLIGLPIYLIMTRKKAE